MNPFWILPALLGLFVMARLLQAYGRYNHSRAMWMDRRAYEQNRSKRQPIETDG